MSENPQSTTQSPSLAAPFNEFFSSFEEAQWGFDLLKTTLLKLGVTPATSKDDKRICICIRSDPKGKKLNLHFARLYYIVSFENKSLGDSRIGFACETDRLPASASPAGEFKEKIGGQPYSFARGLVTHMQNPESLERKAFEESLEKVAEHFATSKGSSWSRHHKAQLLQMVFDAQLRDKLLSEGIELGPTSEGNENDPKPEPPPMSNTLLKALNIILYGPPGTGKTYKLRQKYMDLFTDGQDVRYKFTTFHQSFSYEDFIEGIKPRMDGGDNGQISYEIRNGVFKEICEKAEANPDKDYAIFIDEINRGNVASIFGELITLIEEDKRLDKPNALKACLPYSRKEFGVPKNLWIIGTMNTADRSVEALDTALRRRFIFEEMRPDPELITNPKNLKVDIQRLFNVVNARIEQLLDHDHCIGHAYFMEIETLDDLRGTFANNIVPLLREYFYGNPAKIGMVLGGKFISQKSNNLAFAAGDWGADELDQKAVYQFADVSTLSAEDFASIYA